MVCVGLAIGATAKKARGPVMGLAGLLAAPRTPPVPVLASRTANEFLFPIGCALVVYISKILKKLSGRPEEWVQINPHSQKSLFA